MEKEKLLQLISCNDNLDINTIQATLKELRMEEKILQEHCYSIYLGADNRWTTYFPLENGKRKLVKKKTREDLIKAIVKFYRGGEKSFKRYFEKWSERQQLCGRCDNTIYRYQTDYKRIFEGSKIEYKLVDELGEEDIAEFITDLLNTKDISYKLLKTIFGYFNGIFNKAIKDKTIKENPCNCIDIELYKRKCKEPKEKSNEERILSNDETQMLLDKIDKYINKNPLDITLYAVKLSIYTGMRVGEIAALQWCDVDFNRKQIIIRHSEKRNRLTNEYSIEDTKNSKVRVFPLTNDIEAILTAVKSLAEENNFLNDFIFNSAEGRIHKEKISGKMRNLTCYDKRFSSGKSIHANRRTLNSHLREQGVSVTVASKLLGHTERVNEQNYTYDVADYEYKKQVVSNCFNSVT